MDRILKGFIELNKPLVEKNLKEHINEIAGPSILKQSMWYSLNAGGKRIRPLLLLAVLKVFDKKEGEGLPVASVIEMLHTYSLIHDDLPCIDNDDLRRGEAANHKVFGEAVATLAGNALNTLCFGILARMQHISDKNKIELIDLLSKAAGVEGMIGGQILDIQAEGQQLTLSELENIHINKTGALLRFSVEAGAILADTTEEQRAALRAYAYHIGLAFQIKDDLLDINGTTETLGKTAGKDLINDKTTYPALLGLKDAEKKLQEHYTYAIEALEQITMKDSLLHAFAKYILDRNK